MDLKTAMNIEGDVKHLDTRPPEGSKAVSSFGLEATIENNPQELRRLRSFTALSKAVPSTLSSEAQKIMLALFDCFEKAGSVQEGIIDDIVWGFQQTTPPIDAEVTLKGLEDLFKEDYIRFQSRDNWVVRPTPGNLKHLWVRYQPKLLDMVYEKHGRP